MPNDEDSLNARVSQNAALRKPGEASEKKILGIYFFSKFCLLWKTGENLIELHATCLKDHDPWSSVGMTAFIYEYYKKQTQIILNFKKNNCQIFHRLKKNVLANLKTKQKK